VCGQRADRIFFRIQPAMQLILFLGAGISRPSGLPTAVDLTEYLLGRSAARSHNHKIATDALPPQQRQPPHVLARIPRFLRLLKAYDEADINHVGYTRLNNKSGRYVSTTALFRSGSTYEDLFYLCAQIKAWSSGWSDSCMTTPLMEAIERRGGCLFRGRSKKARLSDVATVAAAACDFMQSEIAAALSGSNPRGLQLIRDLAVDARIEMLNIVTLNHDTLVEQFLSQNAIRFANGFDQPDGDVRWYCDASYDVSKVRVRIFKLHGSIDWYSFGLNGRTAMLLGSEPRAARDAAGNHLRVNGPGPSFLAGLSKPVAYQRGIYTDLHHRFHEMLRLCDRMVMSGYGWGDHAINCRLESWLDRTGNQLVLLHPTPEDLTYRSLIVVSAFDGWMHSRKLVQIRKWMSEVRQDDLEEILFGGVSSTHC
jgi:hypothetical protein